ncbi:FkbM family methyltransferase [Bosea sp. BIWAKO-01]|uniref:FkbM family methyltransferase n=1 Tax=Bosea sp. BIWAKO-01 TaxID=506668 RepID=UPI00086D6DF2|nr:FkbM family methyltransferase [Bosea sp. BIWAKO-01]GAU82901.1 methyltransferase FkbM family [Bosea sp. BIWAKO-01]
MPALHYLSAADLGAMSRQQVEGEIQARVQTAYLGDGLVLARVLGGPKMLLRASDRGFSRHVMLDGYWESWLTVFCARFLQPGMIAFDVGANLGYYTLLFANRVGPAGRIVAIEPNPQTFALLAETVSLNGYDGTVSLVSAAATARSGDQVELFVPLGEPKNATIAFSANDRPSELNTSVPTASIDDLAGSLDRVDFVKIDVEGAEPEVLRGMTATIERHRPTILLEFNASRYGDPASILDRLVSVYGQIGEIDFEGAYRLIGQQEILTERTREDRLLCFAGSGLKL